MVDDGGWWLVDDDDDDECHQHGHIRLYMMMVVEWMVGCWMMMVVDGRWRLMMMVVEWLLMVGD